MSDCWVLSLLKGHGWYLSVGFSQQPLLVVWSETTCPSSNGLVQRVLLISVFHVLSAMETVYLVKTNRHRCQWQLWWQRQSRYCLKEARWPWSYPAVADPRDSSAAGVGVQWVLTGWRAGEGRWDMNELEIFHQKEDKHTVMRVTRYKIFHGRCCCFFVPKLAGALAGNG